MRFTRILRAALIWGSAFAALVLVGGGLVGWAVAGVPGLLSGVLGAVLAAVFMGLTTLSFWIATRRQQGEPKPERFLVIVAVVFFAKLIVFLGGLIWLTNQPWLSPQVFAITAIVAVVGSLAADVIAMVTNQGGLRVKPGSNEPDSAL